jgi:hypothetical protein
MKHNVMFRLIYIDHAKTYQIFDSEVDTDVKNQEKALTEKGVDVLCLVDYRRQFIFKKSALYAFHRELINAFIFEKKTFQKLYANSAS